MLEQYLCVLGSAIGCGAVLIPMSKDDWKDMSVSGELCVLAWCILVASWWLCGMNLITGLIGLALIVLFYFISDSFFGSADMIPGVMYLVVWCSGSTDSWAMTMAYPMCLALLLIPYGKFYAKTHGFKWKFGDKVYMPALPVLTAGWWLSIVCLAIYIVVQVLRGAL